MFDFKALNYPITIPVSDLVKANEQVETLVGNLKDAETVVNGLSAQLTATQSAEQAERETRLKTQEALAKSVARERELQALLDKPPVVTLPVARKPIITKTEIKDVAGIAIPKGNAPSASQDQNARLLMLLWSMMGGNAWRGFMNLQEIKAHTTMLDNNVNHLPGFGRRLGLTFIADTLNNHAVNLSDGDLRIALDGLRKMSGTDKFIGYFDDANQYRDETKYPKGTLERLVKRIRSIAPDIILVASLTANATINDYKNPDTLFDFVEAQTFGKIGELPVFLERSFDVFCLDGRKEISIDYLAKSIDIVGELNPRNIFYYITAITDWQNIPDKLPFIKQIVTRWMAMAR